MDAPQPTSPEVAPPAPERLPFRRILAASLVFSLLLVVGVWVARRHGSSTDPDKYLPLRSVTPEEAAALLSLGSLGSSSQVQLPSSRRAPAAVVTRFDANEVEIATQGLVFQAPAISPEPDFPSTQVAGQRYHMAPATDDAYCLVYHVPRAPLERALGRPLTRADVRAGFLATRQTSFRPDYLALYACAEIAFLTLWIAGLVWVLARVRRRSQLLPVIWCALPMPWVFTMFYSPGHCASFLAEYDTISSYQRIVLEDLGEMCFSLGLVLAIPAALSLAIGVVIFISECVGQTFGASREGSRRVAFALLGGAVALVCARIIA